MARISTRTETELPVDERLKTDHFAIDDNGNVVVKNEDLAKALKAALPDSTDGAFAEVKVGVVVDLPF